MQAIHLEIDESSFTGETEPAQKGLQPVPASEASGGVTKMTNIAFMGTLVRCGRGKVRVISSMSANKTHGKI